MITVDEIVTWCNKNKLKYESHPFGVINIGGKIEKDVDVSSSIHNPKKSDVWYPEFTLKFNPISKKITDFGTGKYDIRNHPKWNVK